MKKLFILAVIASGLIGCASSGRVTELEGTVAGVRADVSALKAEHAAHENAIASLQSRVTAVEDDIKSLTDKFSAHFKRNQMK